MILLTGYRYANQDEEDLLLAMQALGHIKKTDVVDKEKKKQAISDQQELVSLHLFPTHHPLCKLPCI